VLTFPASTLPPGKPSTALWSWPWLNLERLWTGVFLYRSRVQTGANNTGNEWRTEELLKEEVTGL